MDKYAPSLSPDVVLARKPIECEPDAVGVKVTEALFHPVPSDIEPPSPTKVLGSALPASIKTSTLPLFIKEITPSAPKLACSKLIV